MSNISQNNQADDSIDLIQLVRTVWSNRKKIVSITATFVVLGLMIAIFSAEEYTASSMFVPQTGESGRNALGNLGGLASVAGINFGGMGPTTEISPALYPRMVTNIKVLRALINAPLKIENRTDSTTYADYYEQIYEPNMLHYVKKYSIGLPGTIISAIRGEKMEVTEKNDSTALIRLTDREVLHFRRLTDQINVKPNEKEGFVELSVTMPEPSLAAQMAQHAQELLQKEVIAFKISNAREHLNFTEIQYKQKRKEFEETQNRLASFRDRNQNISSAMAMNQSQKLEADFNLAFNIYSEIAKQLEQAKLQVSKDTPIFSIIQAVTIPSEPSAPNRLLIIIVFTIFGFFLSLGIVIFSDLLKNINFKNQE